MADESPKSNKTLYMLAAAAAGVYLLMNRSSAAASTTAAPVSTAADVWAATANSAAPAATVPAVSTQAAPTSFFGIGGGALAAAIVAPVTASSAAPVVASSGAAASGAAVILDQYGIPHLNPVPAGFDLPTTGQPETFKTLSDGYGLYYEEVERLQTYYYYQNYPTTPYAPDFLSLLMQAAQNGQIYQWITAYNSANPSKTITPRK